MILRDHLKPKSDVRISFVGDKSHEITAYVLEYDEQHVAVLSHGSTMYIPWTAIGAVTDLSKPIVMDED